MTNTLIFNSFSDVILWNMQIGCVSLFLFMMLKNVFYSQLHRNMMLNFELRLTVSTERNGGHLDQVIESVKG